MKGRLLTLIAIAGLMGACSKDIALDPAVSLFAPQPEIYEETAIFRLASMAIDTTSAQTFPVTFGGSAEMGVDYTVSGDRFVLGGENPVDSIVVTTLRLGTDKTVSLTVEVPEGIGSGKYLTSEFTIQDKLAYFSFPASYSMVADSLDIEFNALDRKGKAKVLGSNPQCRHRQIHCSRGRRLCLCRQFLLCHFPGQGCRQAEAEVTQDKGYGRKGQNRPQPRIRRKVRSRS